MELVTLTNYGEFDILLKKICARPETKNGVKGWESI